ncbi:amidohydrolase [Cystobacter fuscus DSM 2262]|uniref:Amidohydrolase n=1 Tax=Cystobacter fuscus (strain ATCC 25194 / DSM 2262 / NBRC 100088 / M29) TaxID=1242864 RepID=S9QM94_CYSF2|nr:amidohydrolase family protein [Cystobacter fuscus]EPX62414.1 amidohydrolase [Cystobacter fuscus DSM 2262]
MEGRLVLKNCSIFRADGRGRAGMAVVIEGGLIRQVGSDEEIPVLPGDWEVACRGRLVMPGLVDCHSHLVGDLVMPPSSELLLHPPHIRMEHERLLSSFLTPADVEVLSRHAMARALRSGVTLAVDHLSCPRDVLGGLEAMARSAEQLGMRLVASHCTHALDGDAQAVAQARANAEFVRNQGSHPLVRGALGFHASWTSGDALLGELRRSREVSGSPIIFHLSEGDHDLAITWAKHSQRVVPRLESFGLLGPLSVAAYARSVDDAESIRLAESGTCVALGPGASLLVEPGGRSLETLYGRQNLLGLGSAGHGNLWDALFVALGTSLSAARGSRLVDPDGVLVQLFSDGPAELCSRLFGMPSGTVEEGRLADLVVFDCVPALDPDSGQTPHMIGQLLRSRVAWTVVDGRVTVREGQVLGVDEVALAHDASVILSRLWAQARLPEPAPPPLPARRT